MKNINLFSESMLKAFKDATKTQERLIYSQEQTIALLKEKVNDLTEKNKILENELLKAHAEMQEIITGVNVPF